MHLRLPFTKFLIVSLALHALAVAAALFLIKPPPTPLPFATPVTIVDLPKRTEKQLPPVHRPAPVPQRIFPEKPLPPSAVPRPKQFGASEEIKLPKTPPRSGVSEGAEHGKEAGESSTPENTERSRAAPFSHPKRH